MKKLIVLFSAIAFACCVHAQTSTTPMQAAPATQPKMMHKDWVMMRDGKVMMTKEGKWMPLDKEVTLTNGTKVMADGTVMMKDGTKSMMKNGDRMDMDGKMMPSPRMMARPNQPAQPLQQATPPAK